MNLRSIIHRILARAKLALVLVLRPVRRVAGRLFQVAEHDQIQAVRTETARLSSASVEAVTYLGGEIRALDRRLAELESELQAIRALLEQERVPRSEEAPAPPSGTRSA